MNFFAGITMLVLLPWKKVQIFAVLTATRTKHISICNNLLRFGRFCAKIDRKITKTEMRQQTGISTNMLAKMGKQMPVSMEALAKICNYLGCGLDDVVEIFSFTEEGGDR